jgi:hypothetical protein
MMALQNTMDSCLYSGDVEAINQLASQKQNRQKTFPKELQQEFAMLCVCRHEAFENTMDSCLYSGDVEAVNKRIIN